MTFIRAADNFFAKSSPLQNYLPKIRRVPCPPAVRWVPGSRCHPPSCPSSPITTKQEIMILGCGVHGHDPGLVRVRFLHRRDQPHQCASGRVGAHHGRRRPQALRAHGAGLQPFRRLVPAKPIETEIHRGGQMRIDAMTDYRFKNATVVDGAGSPPFKIAGMAIFDDAFFSLTALIIGSIPMNSSPNSSRI